MYELVPSCLLLQISTPPAQVLQDAFLLVPLDSSTEAIKREGKVGRLLFYLTCQWHFSVKSIPVHGMLAGHSCPSRWPHTHAYMASTNCAQEFINKNFPSQMKVMICKRAYHKSDKKATNRSSEDMKNICSNHL